MSNASRESAGALRLKGMFSFVCRSFQWSFEDRVILCCYFSVYHGPFNIRNDENRLFRFWPMDILTVQTQRNYIYTDRSTVDCEMSFPSAVPSRLRSVSSGCTTSWQPNARSMTCVIHAVNDLIHGWGPVCKRLVCGRWSAQDVSLTCVQDIGWHAIPRCRDDCLLESCTSQNSTYEWGTLLKVHLGRAFSLCHVYFQQRTSPIYCKNANNRKAHFASAVCHLHSVSGRCMLLNPTSTHAFT